MALTAYSELEAVNLILRNMGETSVNSLSNPPLDASEALATLHEVSREVQKRWWYFNTEVLSLSPDNNGIITLPVNLLAVETAGVHRNLKVTSRGGKLYRLEPFNNGPVFDGPMQLRLILGLDRLNTSLLLLTLFVSTVTLGIGRATLLQGAVHLTIFVVFLGFTVFP